MDSARVCMGAQMLRRYRSIEMGKDSPIFPYYSKYFVLPTKTEKEAR